MQSQINNNTGQLRHVIIYLTKQSQNAEVEWNAERSLT